MKGTAKNMVMFLVVYVITATGTTVFLEAADGSYASNPIPVDGAAIPGATMGDDIYTTLDFTAGDGAVSHEAFFSDDPFKVASRDPCVSLGPPPYSQTRYYVGLYTVEPYTDSLVRGVTYYWCVDETDANDNTYPGDVWEFTIQGYKACCPNPPDGAVIVGPDVLLSWVPGIEVDEHDVYFGTDFDDINDVVSGPYDPHPAKEYLGTVEEPRMLVTGLSDNTMYYWRVDEVSNRLPPPLDPGQIYKGDVWCFKTRGPRLFVDADATGANDGSSWPDAFNYIQDALAVVQPDDEIKVAEGIYKPDQGAGQTPGDREATFQLISGVTVKGGYAGFGEPDPDARNVKAYETILSGDLSGNDVAVAEPCDLLTEPTRAENSYHVVSGGGTDETAVVDGFIITAGYANGLSPKNTGGGLHRCNAEVYNCIISWNWAEIYGGGMYNQNYPGESVPIIENCTFSNNSAGQRGGGMYNDYTSSPPRLSNCKFTENSAILGGGMCNYESSPVLTNCIFSGNSASQNGGGMFSDTCPCKVKVINCTFSHNSAGQYGGATFCGDESETQLVNSIFWDNTAAEGPQIAVDQAYYDSLSVSYCNIQDGKDDIYGYDSEVEWGEGNIDDDPLFVDADGIDNIIGTEDDNLRLLAGSPCIDAGDSSVVTVTTDLDGNPRIMGHAVDMGAYEACMAYYVDGVNGDNTNDGLTPWTAFETIQKGIDTAEDGNSVFVYPAVYDEALLINNKEIKLQGVATSAGIPILQKAGDYAVSYYGVEGPYSMLKNFVIRDSDLGVFIVEGSPVISNVTIVDNVFGIAAYAGATPDISNCILWNNPDGDLFGDPDPIEARYSCVQQGSEGEGNISVEPRFVDANNSDYHLLSERGRHWPAHEVWVLDKVTSPCVDGGDPAINPSNEPMPNGGRINMGAYGNTAYASMSEWPIEEDNNRDGIVNMLDLANLAAKWLEKLDWVE